MHFSILTNFAGQLLIKEQSYSSSELEGVIIYYLFKSSSSWLEWVIKYSKILNWIPDRYTNAMSEEPNSPFAEPYELVTPSLNKGKLLFIRMFYYCTPMNDNNLNIHSKTNTSISYCVRKGIFVSSFTISFVLLFQFLEFWDTVIFQFLKTKWKFRKKKSKQKKKTESIFWYFEK